MTWHPDIPEEYRNAIVTGDARLLAERIPDASVDLIFTDPIYDRIEDYAWLAETAARVLKPNSWMLAYFDTKLLPEVAAAMSMHMTYVWQHICYMPTINAYGADYTFITYRSLLRYRKGKPRPYAPMKDLMMDTYDPRNTTHRWAKNISVVSKILEALSMPGDVVVDLFCGGGTMPTSCKSLNRQYIAFEIDPATADRARARVEATQAMHPVLLGVQEEIAWAS